MRYQPENTIVPEGKLTVWGSTVRSYTIISYVRQEKRRHCVQTYIEGVAFFGADQFWYALDQSRKENLHVLPHSTVESQPETPEPSRILAVIDGMSQSKFAEHDVLQLGHHSERDYK
jgi:hypothetical protein